MSAQSDHQNGRPLCSPVQSNVPVNFLSPSDPRLKNLSQSGEVCRNYVWGICKKQGQCKFRHNCTIEEMKTIIRFCHDHQNRKEGCSRPDCSFLHTSSEEEDLFLTTGKIPKILIERYAAISNTNVTPPNGSTLRHLESSPSMYVARPPPPPPPLSTVTGPPPPPPTWPVPVLPPPPPPTEPSTLRAVPTAALFTAPVSNTILKINQPPPPLPPNFDARRPPPPLPAGLINGALKRPLDSCDAGPSKLRKTDDLDDPDTPCELCAQRELSLKLCSEKLQKIITQKECKKLLLKTKKEESESFRAMLGLLVPAEICAAVEEYIEGDYSTTLGLSMETSSMQELLLGYLLDKVHTDVVKENTSRSVSVTSCSRYVSGQRPGGDGQSRPPVPCAEPAPLYPPPFRPDVPPPTVRPPYPTMATPVPPVMQPVCTPTPAPYASVPRAALPPLMPAVPSTTLPSVPPSVPLNGHSYSQFMMGYHSPHYPPPQ